MEDWVTERTVFRISNAIVAKLTARPAIEFAERVEDEILVEAARMAGVDRATLDEMPPPQVRATSGIALWYHVIVETVLSRVLDPEVATVRFWSQVNAGTGMRAVRVAAEGPAVLQIKPDGFVRHFCPKQGGWGASPLRQSNAPARTLTPGSAAAVEGGTAPNTDLVVLSGSLAQARAWPQGGSSSSISSAALANSSSGSSGTSDPASVTSLDPETELLFVFGGKPVARGARAAALATKAAAAAAAAIAADASASGGITGGDAAVSVRGLGLGGLLGPSAPVPLPAALGDASSSSPALPPLPHGLFPASSDTEALPSGPAGHAALLPKSRGRGGRGGFRGGSGTGARAASVLSHGGPAVRGVGWRGGRGRGRGGVFRGARRGGAAAVGVAKAGRGGLVTRAAIPARTVAVVAAPLGTATQTVAVAAPAATGLKLSIRRSLAPSVGAVPAAAAPATAGDASDSAAQLQSQHQHQPLFGGERADIASSAQHTAAPQLQPEGATGANDTATPEPEAEEGALLQYAGVGDGDADDAELYDEWEEGDGEEGEGAASSSQVYGDDAEGDADAEGVYDDNAEEEEVWDEGLYSDAINTTGVEEGLYSDAINTTGVEEDGAAASDQRMDEDDEHQQQRYHQQQQQQLEQQQQLQVDSSAVFVGEEDGDDDEIVLDVGGGIT